MPYFHYLCPYSGYHALIPITRARNPITRTLIPITRPLIPIIRALIPITRALVPITRARTPIVRRSEHKSLRTFGAGAPASTAVAAAAGAAKPDTDGKFEPNLLNSIVFLVTSTMCVGWAAHGRLSQHTRGGRGYVERIYTDI
jgi:hypothetical protein